MGTEEASINQSFSGLPNYTNVPNLKKFQSFSKFHVFSKFEKILKGQHHFQNFQDQNFFKVYKFFEGQN